MDLNHLVPSPSSGLVNFYISVNYLKEQIFDYFQDGSKWGVNIEYLVENEPLGPAGSLSLLPKQTLKEPFIVINGDVLTKLNLRNLISFHKKNNSNATICVRDHSITVPYGVVKVNNNHSINFEEKPTFEYLINAGVYILNPSILSLIPHKKNIDMPSLLIIAQNKGYIVSPFHIHEYWIDIGNPKSLKEADSSWEISKSI